MFNTAKDLILNIGNIDKVEAIKNAFDLIESSSLTFTDIIKFTDMPKEVDESTASKFVKLVEGITNKKVIGTLINCDPVIMSYNVDKDQFYMSFDTDETYIPVLNHGHELYDSQSENLAITAIYSILSAIEWCAVNEIIDEGDDKSIDDFVNMAYENEEVQNLLKESFKKAFDNLK